MDQMKVEPGSGNENLALHPSSDTKVTDVKHEDHLETPIFCAVKSEPQVRFSSLC
jgi:hypothetical protein